MVDWPTYSPDVAICRLLAAEPLPTAIIADRLHMPLRTVRHRLRALRRDAVVATGADGLHRLAFRAGPDLATVEVPAAPAHAALAAPDHPVVAAPDHPVVAAPDHPVVAAQDHAVLAASVNPPDGSSTDIGWTSAIGALAVAVIGLAAAIRFGRRPAVPPAPQIRDDPPVDPWWPDW